MTLEQGSILKGRYQIDGIIAQGGMGAIYKATDIALSVTVALKENLFAESVAIRQFRAEAQILANLRHPNLPRVTDHFEIEDQGQYLVMDFIDGEDIKDILNQKGVFSEEEAIRIGISICDALDYLHRRNPPVVHRDIKPGNVKFNSAGVVHLVDFGLAKQAIAGEQTMTGAQALTPGFAPPEQYGQGTDPRTDIYSLGATLFAAATMEAPPDGLTRATSNATYLNVKDRNPEISKEFSDVINHAMAVSVGDRYQTAKEFKAALEGLKKSGFATENAVVGADSSPTVVQAGGSAHKKKQWWIPVAAIGVLAVIIIVLVSLLSGIGSNGKAPTSTALAAVAEEPLLSTETEQSEEPVVDPATQTPTPIMVAATETIMPTEEIVETTAITEVTVPLATPVGGGGGMIAFASDRANGIPQIFLMNVDTLEMTQLTSLDKGACQPDWSPDGQQIVFTSPCLTDELDYKGSRLYITSVDGSALRPLNTIPGGDFDPAWNPVNPNQIAFVSYRENNRPHLFIYNLDTNAVEGFSASAAYDRAPVWSNDGEMLLFQKVFNGLTQVYTIRLSDKKLASITNGLTDAFDPTWSNSGLLVYFSEGTMGGLSVKLAGVQYGNAAGTKFELEEPKPVWGIDFSDDDNWVVFYGIGNENNRDIFIMPSFGGNTIQLTDDAAQDFDPKWQPVIAP